MKDLPPTSSAQILTLLEHKSLMALFQPIVELQNGVILGYEGLIRGPSDSLLHAPTHLFRAAALHGVRTELELLCHEVICHGFIKHRLEGQLFLNISPDVLVDLLRRHPNHNPFLNHHAKLAAQRIVLELTEGQPLLQFTSEELVSSVHRVTEWGYEVAIDDLGEGFSSLKLWSELRPKFVKIDRYFIQNVENDPVKAHFVRCIVEIAGRAQCEVIAEGIETDAELRLVRSMGGRIGQGYFLARPHAHPLTTLPEAVKRILHSFQAPALPGVNSWGRDTLIARQIIVSPAALPASSSNETAFLRFDRQPELDSMAVVDAKGVPVGLLTRTSLLENFAQPYRHELYGKRSCTQFMDTRPLIVDKTTTVQDISRMLGQSDRRHFTQGFIVTDTGKYYGLAHGHDLIRIITEMQIQAAKYANPLTQLPGNVPIHEHLDGLLRSKVEFCACYCDLDHFKPYNDAYGFSAGDTVIQLTANLLAEVCDRELDFLGHIGGDDFIILFRSPDWEQRCRQVLTRFEAVIQDCFSAEDVKRGGYYSENRRLEQEFHSLTALSIGAVVVPPGHFTSYMEVSRIASGAKKQAKQCPGNALFINRRLELPQQTVPLQLSVAAVGSF